MEEEKMNTLYIVIPAYNERDTIRQVIEQWYPVVEKIGGGRGSLLLMMEVKMTRLQSCRTALKADRNSSL